ncbi:MAG: HIT family protein [Sinobacteraceae bacterium]|nr:HIT family protein [Nevskiaceae bacterium]
MTVGFHGPEPVAAPDQLLSRRTRVITNRSGWHTAAANTANDRATDQGCPFCNLPSSRVVHENVHAVVIRDGFPVSQGHTLVIARRHVGSFFELTADERAGLMALVDTAKGELDASHTPEGYNIGINDGPAAGQTVPHVHMHLIPRYLRDVEDPRGGVRWVIPEKARYWP